MPAPLNWIDRLVAAVNPQAGIKRAGARQALAYYEAARNTRHRKLNRDRSSGDQIVGRDAATLRAQARHLDRNHDLARSVLNVLVRNVIGPNGIGVEPTPRMANDDISDAFARQLLNLWHEWSENPFVTGDLDMGCGQQLLARSWLRDGDAFTQMLAGPVPLLTYGTRIPMALELIEAEFCPLDYNDDDLGIRQGIQINAWRQKRAYYFYKDHPGDGRAMSEATKSVPAEAIAHLAMRDRISQLRGVSIFASVMTRLDDIKDYEESERIAARIAASMAAYIKKGSPELYTPPAANEDGSTPAARLLDIRPGTIFDDLQMGEDVGMISSDRPNAGLVPFRDGQLRAVSGGVDAGYSSVSRNYGGNYSAQRQELVEQDSAYKTLSRQFIAQHLRPVWKRFVQTVVLAGLAKPPPGVRPETYAQAEFMPPVMPWIDPLKEINAIEKAAQAGLKPMTSAIRERNGSLQNTLELFGRERRLAKELKLVFTSDPANQAAAATPPPAPPADPNANPNPGPNPDPNADPNADPAVDPSVDPANANNPPSP